MAPGADRRTFIASAIAAAPAVATAGAFAQDAPPAAETPAPHDHYPALDPELATRVVGLAHRDLDGVKQLVEKQPELARATTDWGFGDFETALGAASHTGRHAIAELLIAHGARPTLFTHAMMGHLDVVRASIETDPNLARVKGPHGITLTAHARAGRERATEVAAYLETVDGADEAYDPEPVPDPAALIGGYLPEGGEKGFVVEAGRQAPITLRPEGSFSRNLIHLGGNVFHPPGAESARIAFDASEIPTVLSVTIGGVTRRYVRQA